MFESIIRMRVQIRSINYSNYTLTYIYYSYNLLISTFMNLFSLLISSKLKVFSVRLLKRKLSIKKLYFVLLFI